MTRCRRVTTLGVSDKWTLKCSIHKWDQRALHCTTLVEGLISVVIVCKTCDPCKLPCRQESARSIDSRRQLRLRLLWGLETIYNLLLLRKVKDKSYPIDLDNNECRWSPTKRHQRYSNKNKKKFYQIKLVCISITASSPVFQLVKNPPQSHFPNKMNFLKQKRNNKVVIKMVVWSFIKLSIICLTPLSWNACWSSPLQLNYEQLPKY